MLKNSRRRKMKTLRITGSPSGMYFLLRDCLSYCLLLHIKETFSFECSMSYTTSDPNPGKYQKTPKDFWKTKQFLEIFVQ